MGQITLQAVRKSFGPVNIIKDTNLDIENGSFVVFVGPSGCGKTTLLRLIAGLEDVTGGQILIDGRNVVDVPPAKRGLSMVFQSYALYPHMSVRGNIAFGLKMAGLPRAEIERKVEAAAATLNLTPYLDRKPRELSGGQSCASRRHFCSTSRCRISTPRSASRCAWKLPSCKSSSGPPPSTSRTTRSRP
jgi:multiple sugar transport system ATP-binding protein